MQYRTEYSTVTMTDKHASLPRGHYTEVHLFKDKAGLKGVPDAVPWDVLMHSTRLASSQHSFTCQESKRSGLKAPSITHSSKLHFPLLFTLGRVMGAG